MMPFDYVRPQEWDAARAAWQEAGDARYLSGGQSLLAALKLRLAQPDRLVDLRFLPGMTDMVVTPDGVKAGAGATHARMAEACGIPVLAGLATSIGDRQVRNMGTLGGALANADPASDWAAAVLGLGAVIQTDRRSLAADDFFTGLFETTLEPGEIIASVFFPRPKRAAYAKLRNPASGYAVVGVLVAETVSGPRVAVTGAGTCPFRLAEFESALSLDLSAAALAGLSVPPDDLNRDLHATAEYRAHLIAVLAARAVESLT